MKPYHEHVFNEIAKIIVDNLEIIYWNNGDTLNNIRNYCVEHDHKRYKPLDYFTLINFVNEALTEITRCNYLYDFRDIE